jgi:hypothetical protein
MNKYVKEHPEYKKIISRKCRKWWKEHPDFHKGKNHPSYGKKHSSNHKKRISLSLEEYNKEHPEQGEKHSKYLKRWWDNHPEEKSKQRRLVIRLQSWHKEHPDYCKGKNNHMFGKTGILCPSYGRRHSIKSKKKQSEIRIEYFRTHPPTYPKARFVKKLGHVVRSSWEEKIGLLLKSNHIKYDYEPDRIDLGDAVYIPDFKINPRLYIEVKGRLFKRNKRNLKKFHKMYPNKKLIGIGDGNERYYDVHLKWENREILPDVIEEMRK